MVKELGKMTP